MIIVIVAASVYFSYIVKGYDGNDTKWIYVTATMDDDDIASMLESELGTTGKRAATLLSLTSADAPAPRRIHDRAWHGAR